MSTGLEKDTPPPWDPHPFRGPQRKRRPGAPNPPGQARPGAEKENGPSQVSPPGPACLASQPTPRSFHTELHRLASGEHPRGRQSDSAGAPKTPGIEGMGGRFPAHQGTPEEVKSHLHTLLSAPSLLPPGSTSWHCGEHPQGRQSHSAGGTPSPKNRGNEGKGFQLTRTPWRR